MEFTFHMANLGDSCDRCVWNPSNVSVVDETGKLSLNMSDEKVPPLNAAIVRNIPECC